MLRAHPIQISRCHGERLGAGVGGPDAAVGNPLGQLGGQRERDGARAGAGIDDGRRLPPETVELMESHLDHLLGLGTWDEHAGVDQEIERAEGPMTEDVLQGLARPTACFERTDRRQVGRPDDLTGA